MARKNNPLAATSAEQAEWEALYALADRVFTLKPWMFHLENDIFGIQNPETGEISYVCVMGDLGEHCALAFYRGTDGLNGLLKMHMAGDPEAYHGSEILFWQDCLMLSFENRDEISEPQRACIKALGRSYRGNGTWPCLQSFVPYRFPWDMTPAERAWMKVALEQALDVLTRAREDILLIPDVEPLGPHLVRVRQEDGTWKDSVLPIAPRRESGLQPTPVDSALIALLAKNPRLQARLELGRFPFPEPVQNSPDSPPTFVMALLLIEPTSGAVLGYALPEYADLPAQVQKLLADALQKHEMLPTQIAISDPALYRLVKPLADALQIPLELPESMPGLESAIESLMGQIGRFS
jgi:hypothetical protein